MQCSPEVNGRSTARKATRKQRWNCVMFRLSGSRYARITIVLLDRSFVTESSAEIRLSPHYLHLALYDLWQYRPRFLQNNQTLRPLTRWQKTAIVDISHNAMGCSSHFSIFQLNSALRACLHGSGGPRVGEVTRLGGVTRLSIKFLILFWWRLHDKWGDPPRRVARSVR